MITRELLQDLCGLFILRAGRWIVTLCMYDSPSMDFALLLMLSSIVVEGGCIGNARFTFDELTVPHDRFCWVFSIW